MSEYDSYPEYEEYYDEPGGPNRTWLIVAIVVVVLLLCCCCLAAVLGIALYGGSITQYIQ